MIQNRRFVFLSGRFNGDFDKLVLPSILFFNTNHKAFKERRRPGFVLMLSWWDFHIGVVMVFKHVDNGQ